MPYRDKAKKREAERRRRARLREARERSTRSMTDPPPVPADPARLPHLHHHRGRLHVWSGSDWLCAHCDAARIEVRPGEPVWLLIAGRFAVRAVLPPPPMP